MKAIIFLILISISSISHADELRFLFASKHYAGDEYSTNERNYGLIFKNDSSIFFGAFRNSYHTTTTVVGKSFNFFFMEDKVRIELATGLMYGYGVNHGKPASPKIHGKRILPLISPSIGHRLSNNSWFNTTLTAGAIAWSFSYSF